MIYVSSRSKTKKIENKIKRQKRNLFSMFSWYNCVALVRSSSLEATPPRSCNFFGNRRDNMMNEGLERGIEEMTWWIEDERE